MPFKTFMKTLYFKRQSDEYYIFLNFFDTDYIRSHFWGLAFFNFPF